MIVWDIETGALPWGLLQALVPTFDELAAVPDVGEFDPASVATGNLKDPAKIAVKLEEAKARHELLASTVAARRAEARNAHVAKFTEKAALSACTGMVKAIGVLPDGWESAILWHAGSDQFPTEATLIRGFWSLWAGESEHSFVGHNIFGFDLPFLVRRSWLLGIDVPKSIRSGRYWASKFIDTMDVWSCGSRDYVKLDDICKALGIPGKPDDCDGASFARLFDNGGADREKALAYLRNDLEMTRRVAEAMQLL